jgi:hypothetical protein
MGVGAEANLVPRHYGVKPQRCGLNRQPDGGFWFVVVSLLLFYGSGLAVNEVSSKKRFDL